MTDHADNYTVNEHGIIQDPGKFEAEPAYAPYFYHGMLEGAEDETIYDNDRPIAVFVVTEADRAKFPELLAGVECVVVWETDQGFCQTREMSKADVDRYRAECENAEPTEPDEDAITTADHYNFYQYGKLVFTVAPVGDKYRLEDTEYEFPALYDSTEQAIRAYMDRTQFWPGTWFISDHGNAHRIEL